MFRSVSLLSAFRTTFLCLRRGVSCTVQIALDTLYFSLPTQRCFRFEQFPCFLGWLFSAYAEVFPTGIFPVSRSGTFLCLRRGVSLLNASAPFLSSFSLPTQRCFLLHLSGLPDGELFSAYAEVFLMLTPESLGKSPFLCLRRGVSPTPASNFGINVLFSAYAEVFPSLRPPPSPHVSFLCLRRGVSPGIFN